MEFYIAAETRESGFVGQFRAAEIIEKFNRGELPGEYVVTASGGSSYRDVMNSGTAQWMSVAEFVKNPPVEEKREAPIVATPAPQSVVLRGGVTIVDIRMPFGSMVVFMIKWAIAAIPALIVLAILWLFVQFLLLLVGATLGGLMR